MKLQGFAEVVWTGIMFVLMVFTVINRLDFGTFATIASLFAALVVYLIGLLVLPHLFPRDF